MPVELTPLRTFVTVAETLNFTRAASRLHLTQSAVSHQIKALEQELGEPLFLRGKAGVRLSQAGRQALPHAQRALEAAETLRQRVSGEPGALSGRVRVAAATQAFVHLFAPVFESFMAAHKGVTLAFRTSVSTDQTLSEIAGGGADVGFASLPVRGPALATRFLFEDELALVAAPAHALAGQREVAARELARHRFVLFERGNSIRRTSDDFFARAGVVPEIALESNDTFFVGLMVQRGAGLSLLPGWAVRDLLQAGALVRIAIRGHRLRRRVAAVALRRFQPGAVRAFLDHVEARRAELQARALPAAERSRER